MRFQLLYNSIGRQRILCEGTRRGDGAGWQVEIARLPVVARLGDDSVAKGLLTTAKLRCYAQKLGQKNREKLGKPRFDCVHAM